MVDLISTLSEAAAHGVEVTIITNGYPAPTLRFKWKHESKWWGAISTYFAAGFELRVIDYDGDSSSWALMQGKTTLAHGETYECQPYYHFDACLLAAEEALRSEVSRRIAAARARRLARG
ncbi:hypothetical protein EN875_032340 [Mesorhizobium sp. M2D.F.Ca.ET.232.01.1.1]|uniref:hypothetical protein n=1 Tax=Mesorhizobium sp. M2D.F.Ca.ET.232.01.1.1 TaxID=2496670 RepID=UPI000FCBE150|nr:hypothetical protein [Mesorhizobium sp. M2D.F.Ca.ET.232.01.1.1]TGP28248.1 hypothetical protein EN875_032340 [Mesorhizobium sp. M2D.F.Ca.ET.232.01.1.1]